MKITDIRLALLPKGALPLCAYCTVTFDDQLVVRDLRIVRNGQRTFVAMPNRKRTQACPRCHTPNSILANFCSHCGLATAKKSAEMTGNLRAHVDIAHPLTPAFRTELENQIIDHYEKSLERSA